MINRTLIRTKVVQTLFSHYYNEEGNSLLSSKKNLLDSFDDTYSLYMLMLDFVNEIVRAADDKIAFEEERAKVLHQPYTANVNFVNNRFAAQIFNNRVLRSYVDEHKLSWDAAHENVRLLWKQIQESNCYKEYMQIEQPTYQDDKTVWRKIVSDVLANNDDLCSALEELEVALDHKDWTTDYNVVLSYIVKTIKRFQEDNGANQALLEMFDSEEELNFGKQLLKAAIDHYDEYTSLIEAHLQNWDINRIAYMDKIILLTALAEILTCPNIPLEITMNEYIEIAKDYSTEKSYQFINAILDEIVRKLKKENKLLKAVVLD